jgi:hypothetical protein
MLLLLLLLLLLLQVRLAYAGLELPPSSDGCLFTAKPGVTKLFTMRRAAAGGGWGASSSNNVCGARVH